MRCFDCGVELLTESEELRQTCDSCLEDEDFTDDDGDEFDDIDFDEDFPVAE